ncbi:MAG: M23 family metallopeptidase [Patescibacteria group bacterium]|nr:M23 family metallopeptidase [Patescibacteria group bacterium]
MIIVKLYANTRIVCRRLGWRGLEYSFFSFLFNQKFVHVIVIIVTVSLLFINLTPKTRASGFNDKINQTILSRIIQSEFSGLEDNQQLILETFDKEAVISPSQQKYLDNLDSFRAQPKISLKKIDKTVEIPTIQSSGSIIKPELTKTNITKQARTKTIDYMVLPGNTVSTIAQTYGVSVNTILWENNKSAHSIIRPGDILKILPFTGLNHTIIKGDNITMIAKKYDVEEDAIMEANALASGDTLKIGRHLLIPDGYKKAEQKYAPKTYTGFSAITDIVKKPNAVPASGNKMNWPTASGRISQYYSWRHHGLDIANNIGTAIYAADAGTIEVLGWGTGYGNQIVIDHGGGKKTRYAHLSKFYVKRGDLVNKGQTIAGMGSTGWSTGSHLHFEIIINNKRYNPLNYIK